MFLTKLNIAVMGFGSLLIVVFIILLLVSLKYKDLIEPLDEKNFPAHELYTFGFLMLDILHYDFNSKKNVTRKKECELWYGKQYAVYYVKANAAQRITLATVIFLFGFIMFGLTSEIIVILVVMIMAFAVYMNYAELIKKKLHKRSEEILSQFPDVVAELALLINAGMIMKEAWQKIAYDGEGEIYKYMKKSVTEMENGVSEAEAYSQFANDCMVQEVKKFTSTIVQGLEKGNSEMSEMLKQQSNEVWIFRQNQVRQMGEKAASKLLVPILIMFIGILIMIIVPIFANI